MGSVKTVSRGVLTLMIALIVGCQTAAHIDWTRVHAGMDKEQILEVMGNPVRTERMNNKDRWTFVFYENQVRQIKEVIFLDGISIYTGDHQEPPVQQSAATVDAQRLKQAIENEEADKRDKENEKLRKRHLPSTDEQPNHSGRDSNGNKSTTQPNPRYAPEFEPL